MKSGQSNGKKTAKQMEKGLGLYVSPISRFPDFLQGQGGKGENEAKKITQSPSTITEKTMKHVQNNGKKHVKTYGKRLEIAFLSIAQQCSIWNQFQGFLTFCRVIVKEVRTICPIKKTVVKNL